MFILAFFPLSMIKFVTNQKVIVHNGTEITVAGP